MVTKLLDDVARSEATEIRRRVATIASKAEEDERRCVQPVQHTDGDYLHAVHGAYMKFYHKHDKEAEACGGGGAGDD